MRKIGKQVFWVILALVLAVTVATFLGVSTWKGDIKKTYIKGAEDIRWGIDIRGGVDVTFSPPEGYDATDDEMAAAKAIIEVRLVNQNITDYEVYTDLNKDRVIVRFPWKEGEADFNPEKAIQELGATAMLTFREGVQVDDLGKPTGVTLNNIILQGQDVKKAEVKISSGGTGSTQAAGEPVVSLELSPDGAKKFSEATGRLVGSPISIWMDDTLISAPTVNQQITDGKAMITGSFTTEEATDMANKINAGALPFKLQTENYNTISPSLGMGAKDAMVLAGVIAFILVCIFMLSFYRVPGIVACIVLLGQISLIIASITGFFGSFNSFTLTLPGIAGIILSIGMGVDANVITSERIKEEITLGKTIDGAIEAGYTRAFSAIVDGNMTTVIVAAILMAAFGPPDSVFAKIFSFFFRMFGPSTAGNIYSFGYTLLMGVIFNMFMGVYVSRWLLKSLSKHKAMRKPWLYGGPKEGKTTKGFHVDFNKNSKKYIGGSLGIFAVIIVGIIALGIQLDIQFRGGAMVTYAYDGSMDMTRFQQIMSEEMGTDIGIQQSTDVASGLETVIVSLPGTRSLSSDEMVGVTDKLQAEFPENNPHTVEISNVDPTIGKEFLAKCLTAVAVALALMMVYVAFRFRKIGGLSAGAMGVVALAHDCIIVFGVFVLFRIPLNSNFIAVILTILGYSINDTIIIYDRIRENKRLHGAKLRVGELVNKSINQTLTRSINTSITTIMAMVIVTVVSVIFGLDSIFSFALPLMIGLVAGSYSSICIAGPLWVKWQEHKQAKKAA